MLYLLFRLGCDRYALEANRIIEVVPYVHLEPLPHAPKGIAGVFNYHGKPVPAVDLSDLVAGRPAPQCLSTRIIIVDQQANDGRSEVVGLIAEQATETVRKGPREFSDASISSDQRSLGPITMDGNRAILWVRQDRLLPDSVRSFLASKAMGPGHEAA